MFDNTQLLDGTLASGGTVTGTAITATRVSTNVIDWGIGRDLGADHKLGIHVIVTEAFATLTSLQIEAQVSADNSTFFGVLISEVIPVAQLILGSPIFRYGYPLNQVLNATAGVLKFPGRYFRLNYTVAGSNATTGKVFSYINPWNDRRQFYAPAINYSLAIATGEI